MLLFFFFYTNKKFRDMYTCFVDVSTVRRNVCMYLQMCGSSWREKRKKKHPSIHFSFLVHSFCYHSLFCPTHEDFKTFFILLMAFEK